LYSKEYFSGRSREASQKYRDQNQHIFQECSQWDLCGYVGGKTTDWNLFGYKVVLTTGNARKVWPLLEYLDLEDIYWPACPNSISAE